MTSLSPDESEKLKTAGSGREVRHGMREATQRSQHEYAGEVAFHG